MPKDSISAPSRTPFALRRARRCRRQVAARAVFAPARVASSATRGLRRKAAEPSASTLQAAELAAADCSVLLRSRAASRLEDRNCQARLRRPCALRSRAARACHDAELSCFALGVACSSEPWLSPQLRRLRLQARHCSARLRLPRRRGHPRGVSVARCWAASRSMPPAAASYGLLRSHTASASELATGEAASACRTALRSRAARACDDAEPLGAWRRGQLQAVAFSAVVPLPGLPCPHCPARLRPRRPAQRAAACAVLQPRRAVASAQPRPRSFSSICPQLA